MRTERMPDPVTLVPGAAEALGALNEAVAQAGVDGRLLAMCRLRAGQLNGCAAGVERAARLVTAPEQVAVWRDTRWFSDEERAALALTEAVTGAEVPDRVWDVAATHFDQKELATLLLAVAITNAENRMDTSTRRQAGR